MKAAALVMVGLLLVAGCRSSSNAMTEDIAATLEARDLLLSLQTAEELDQAKAKLDASSLRLSLADQAVAQEVIKNGRKAPGTEQQRRDLQDAVELLRAEEQRVAALHTGPAPVLDVEKKPVFVERGPCEHDCVFESVREQIAATTACHYVLEWVRSESDATASLEKVKDCAQKLKAAQAAAANDLDSGRVSADDKAALHDARAAVENDLWRIAGLPNHGAEVNAVGYATLNDRIRSARE